MPDGGEYSVGSRLSYLSWIAEKSVSPRPIDAISWHPFFVALKIYQWTW
tara:strand:- start:96 stop:242 length:147 start_codon:yes stop_codon:yes gene_type:complete